MVAGILLLKGLVGATQVGNYATRAGKGLAACNLFMDKVIADANATEMSLGTNRFYDTFKLDKVGLECNPFMRVQITRKDLEEIYSRELGEDLAKFVQVDEDMLGEYIFRWTELSDLRDHIARTARNQYRMDCDVPMIQHGHDGMADFKKGKARTKNPLASWKAGNKVYSVLTTQHPSL